ncbi:MAG TPA: DDE-type integrase/transposase/recombinase [Rhodanobacteraceae bacterium]|nr:DDE-type integrase/transposase/recombinase [Rhodanobacteraceae bacterium]
MHTADIARMQTLQTIATRLADAPYRARGAIVAEGAQRLGVSRQTLYNQLRAVGYRSGRKLRADKGDSRIDPSEVKAVAAMLNASRRTTGKRLLPVGDAASVARANNVLTTDCSTTTLLRLMRKQGCHPDQLSRATPHVEMRSLHPNHVWQLDASICVLYYLKNGHASVMDERKFNARKPKDLARVAKQRVLRYALTDHYSGTVAARYYHTAGEDQQTLFEFLMWAMQRQGDRVLHGVPHMLVWDAGSANTSHAILNLLTALGIRHWTHVPGNPRAKGQVEGVHNIIERKFEGRLTFTHTDSIEQLNAHLDTWLRDFNGIAVHRRHGHARNAMWQTIRQDQLRLCPSVADCAVMMTSKPVERVVAGNLTISFAPKGHASATYSVAHIDTLRVGERVEVIVNPYRAPAIWIMQRDEHGALRYVECDPVEREAAGFAVAAPVFGDGYAAQPDTDVDTARKDANEAAYGARDTLDAMAAKARDKIAFGGAIDPFEDLRQAAANLPSTMQRPGSTLSMPNPMHIDLKPLNQVEMLLELRARLGRPVASAEREAVQTWFPEGCQPADLDGLVERIQQLSTTAAGAPPATDMPRLRAVQ